MIKGQTFANQKIRSEDSAAINSHNAIADNGAMEGIGTEVLITNNGGVFTFGAGKILCQGRIVEIEQNTQITVPVAPGSAVIKGYLILRIDLSEEPPDVEADDYNGVTNQCYITYKEGSAGGGLPELVQNNLNDNGSIYELPLVSYDKTNTGFSNVTRVLTTIKKNNVGNGYVAKAMQARTIEFTTTAPTAASTNAMSIAILTSLPNTVYNGWLYLITE